MHDDYLKELSPVKVAIFGEMKMFEHTKCKPVSIAVHCLPQSATRRDGTPDCIGVPKAQLAAPV